jgi:hypothetical protein
MGSDRGTGPATPVSPVHLASKTGEADEKRCETVARLRFDRATLIEVTRQDDPWPELEPLEEDEGAVRDINEVFRRKLMGLRRLRRYERPHALRAAREARLLALKALKEKRATERHARHALRCLRRPVPM